MNLLVKNNKKIIFLFF